MAALWQCYAKANPAVSERMESTIYEPRTPFCGLFCTTRSYCCILFFGPHALPPCPEQPPPSFAQNGEYNGTSKPTAAKIRDKAALRLEVAPGYPSGTDRGGPTAVGLRARVLAAFRYPLTHLPDPDASKCVVNVGLNYRISWETVWSAASRLSCLRRPE